MEVILTEDVPKLGKMGEVVKVKEGFGRNFLLPQKKAILSSSKNMKAFEAQKKMIELKAAQVMKDAESVASRLQNLEVTIEKEVGENDRLFGSVTNVEIAEHLQKQGIEIDRHKIFIETPIKSAGDHEVEIKVHSEVKTLLKVKVTPKA